MTGHGEPVVRFDSNMSYYAIHCDLAGRARLIKLVRRKNRHGEKLPVKIKYVDSDELVKIQDKLPGVRMGDILGVSLRKLSPAAFDLMNDDCSSDRSQPLEEMKMKVQHPADRARRHTKTSQHPSGAPLWICEKCQEWKPRRHFEATGVVAIIKRVLSKLKWRR